VRPLKPFLAISLILAVSVIGIDAQVSVAGPSNIVTAQPGPWGNLRYFPIYLEAPTSLVEAFPLPNSKPYWAFPESEASGFPDVLRRSGVTEEVARQLLDPQLYRRENGWIYLAVPIPILESLATETRSKIYTYLAQYPLNEFCQDPVLILSDKIESWFEGSELRPEIITKISKLAYRRGDLWAFSDLPLLLNYTTSEQDARIIFKAITRTRTYLVKVVIDQATDASAIRRYWSLGDRGFRLKDIEPLIESVKRAGTSTEIDLAHLLPPLPRKLMFTYPDTEAGAKGIYPDCHWTSLNFFNYDPHQYFLDSRLATNRVIEDYTPIAPPYAYGDILFFLDQKAGNAFHSCVYLGEELVFTKNGRNQLAPWTVSTLSDVSRIYLSATPGRIQGYRKKELH